MSALLEETDASNESLKKAFTAWSLMALGIGAVIG